ncbi:MAG: sulfotransferase, partial [Pseudomonadota bacterium]
QAQTLDAIEIIIVDDCSTNDTADVIKGLASEDARIVGLTTSANAGPSSARHLGIQAARSDYVATLDADDVYLSPKKLEAELDLARGRSNAERPAIGYSRYVVLDADLQPWPKALQPAEPLRDGDLAQDLFARSVHVPRDFVMPKALYDKVGGYDPSIPLYEDWDLKLRLAARADFFRTDVDGTGYVQVEGGLSKTLPSEHEAWLGAIFRKNIDLLDPDRQAAARSGFNAFLAKQGWQARLDDPPGLSERERLGEGLVFLISMPRAGSTLTQRLLAAHPAIHSRSESWLMLQPLLAREPDGLWARHNHELSVQGLDDFIDHLPNGEADYRHWLRTCYAGLYRDAARAANARYYLDKTPRYHTIWPSLTALFPRAKIILLWRHPLATLQSMLEVMDHDRRRLDFWAIDLQEGLENLLALSASGRALEIVYEDLIREPEAALRKVTDHLGLPFEPAMLDLDGGWPGGDASLGDQKQASTARTLDASRLDGWRQAILDRPAFAALADAYLRAHEEALRSAPYDYDEMRALVPKVGDRDADAVVARAAGQQRPPRLRSRADISRADRWQKRLARIGPLPYALGRLVWRTYRNIRS